MREKTGKWNLAVLLLEFLHEPDQRLRRLDRQRIVKAMHASANRAVALRPINSLFWLHWQTGLPEARWEAGR